MTQEIPQSWDALGEEQLRIYAREVAGLYQEEQKLRQELEEKNRELEQRVRELTGLNNLLQQHLTEESPMVEAMREMAVTLEGFSREAGRLAEKAKSLLEQDIMKGQEKLDDDKKNKK